MLSTTVQVQYLYNTRNLAKQYHVYFMDTHIGSKVIKNIHGNNKHQIQGRSCFWVRGSKTE